MTNTGEDSRPSAQGNDRVKTQSSLRRRRVLATAGATLVGGLAGCGGSEGGDTETDTADSDDTPTTESGTETASGSATGTIESVEFLPDSQSFEVTFSSPDAVAEVRVERPDGETERETAVDGGSATVSAQLYDSESIPGGTYTIRTLFNGEETGSATLDVRKTLSVTDVTTVAGDEYPTLVVTVENVGDISVSPEAIELSGSISDTTSLYGRMYSRESVPVGETAEIQIPFDPEVREETAGSDGYAFDGETQCSGSGPVTVTVRQDRVTDPVVYDEVTATVSIASDAVGESRDRYTCSQISVESVSRSDSE